MLKRIQTKYSLNLRFQDMMTVEFHSYKILLKGHLVGLILKNISLRFKFVVCNSFQSQ